MSQFAEKGLPVTVEEEWGVHYSPETSDPDKAVRSFGTGYWAKLHAEQEVERTLHNGKLPSVGQPKTAAVVHRTVTRFYDATDWTRVFPPGGCDQ